MSMKNIDDATQHDALARLAAAKPHTATDRPDDFIAAAIANSDALAASAKAPRLRGRSLTLAAVAGACAVGAFVTGPGMLTAAQTPQGYVIHANGNSSGTGGDHSNMSSSLISPLAFYTYRADPSLPSEGATHDIYKLHSLHDMPGTAEMVAKYFNQDIADANVKDYNNGQASYIFKGESGEEWLSGLFDDRKGVTNFWVRQSGSLAPETSAKSAAEGEAVVHDWLASLGLASTTAKDVADGDYQITVLDNSMYTNALSDTGGGGPASAGLRIRATLMADGRPTAVGVLFDWTTDGHLDSVGGSLATLEIVGTYETVAISEAVRRIGQPFHYFGVSGLPIEQQQWSNRTYWAHNAQANRELRACVPWYVVKSDPITDECKYPVRQYEGRTVAVLTETVVKANPANIMVSGRDGAYLVPGFDFFDESGYVGSAESVVDGVIAVPSYVTDGWN